MAQPTLIPIRDFQSFLMERGLWTKIVVFVLDETAPAQLRAVAQTLVDTCYSIHLRWVGIEDAAFQQGMQALVAAGVATQEDVAAVNELATHYELDFSIESVVYTDNMTMVRLIDSINGAKRTVPFIGIKSRDEIDIWWASTKSAYDVGN